MTCNFSLRLNFINYSLLFSDYCDCCRENAKFNSAQTYSEHFSVIHLRSIQKEIFTRSSKKFRMKLLVFILLLTTMKKTESNKFSSCCDGDKQIKFDGICASNSADDRTVLEIGRSWKMITTTKTPCHPGLLRDRMGLCRNPSLEISTKLCKTQNQIKNVPTEYS